MWQAPDISRALLPRGQTAWWVPAGDTRGQGAWRRLRAGSGVAVALEGQASPARGTGVVPAASAREKEGQDMLPHIKKSPPKELGNSTGQRLVQAFPEALGEALAPKAQHSCPLFQPLSASEPQDPHLPAAPRPRPQAAGSAQGSAEPPASGPKVPKAP